jgi:hypothetical protein
MTPATNLSGLREEEYQQRSITNRLRREVYQQTDPMASTPLLQELREAEESLSTIEEELAKATVAETKNNRAIVIDTRKTEGLLGPQTTGLDVEINLRLAQVPTSICHLLDPEQHPLVTCEARNTDASRIRRLRVSSFVEGYSARAVDTIELDKLGRHEFQQLPTFFPERLRHITELTRATLNVTVEDLDGKVELQKTKPIWLLARTTAPLAVLDPKSGEWQDMTQYLGAFVTPNAQRVMAFLREASEFHAQRRFVGYQGDKSLVEPQIRALFDALKKKAEINYVNSIIEFSPEDEGASAHQRVRLPRESLKDKQANCIDGTVLYASLLEGISMNPAIVIVPGHAFIAWETWNKSNEWKYLETTMIGSNSFEEACKTAEDLVKFYQTLAALKGGASRVKQHSLSALRSIEHIMPME